VLTEEELDAINMQVPLAIKYLVEATTKLMEHIDRLEEERDVYKEKFENEAELRQLTQQDMI